MAESKEMQAPQEAEKSALSPFYGTARDVVARYTHCALCGANLHFTHVTDFARNLTQETAKCPECGVKARQSMHRLQ
jgi:DNA-directed RNA polymerase subunit RPC12/RpoP